MTAAERAAPGAAAAPVQVRRVRIEPVRGWSPIDLRELWQFRDLLAMFASRDVKLRYRQTALGVAWVVLQPLLASVIFAVIFGELARLPSGGLPYLLFVFSGLLPWNFFAAAVQRSSRVLVDQSTLITKVYFPRMIAPLASAGGVLVDLLVALVVMAVLLALYGVAPTPRLLALPAVVAVLLVVTAGVSLWISALTVYYRDFVHALPFLLQVWLYGSPVVYSTGIVRDPWLPLYALNPLVGVIEGFRWALLGRTAFPALPLGLALVVGCLIFGAGALVFRRVERSFADVI